MKKYNNIHHIHSLRTWNSIYSLKINWNSKQQYKLEELKMFINIPKNFFTGISAARLFFFLELRVLEGNEWMLLLSTSWKSPSISKTLSKSKLFGRVADVRVKTISSSWKQKYYEHMKKKIYFDCSINSK